MNDEQVEEIKRHFGVVAEGLRSEIWHMAKRVETLNEKLDREIAAVRQEMKKEIIEIRSILKFPGAEERN